MQQEIIQKMDMPKEVTMIVVTLRQKMEFKDCLKHYYEVLPYKINKKK